MCGPIKHLPIALATPPVDPYPVGGTRSRLFSNRSPTSSIIPVWQLSALSHPLGTGDHPCRGSLQQTDTVHTVSHQALGVKANLGVYVCCLRNIYTVGSGEIYMLREASNNRQKSARYLLPGGAARGLSRCTPYLEASQTQNRQTTNTTTVNTRSRTPRPAPEGIHIHVVAQAHLTQQVSTPLLRWKPTLELGHHALVISVPGGISLLSHGSCLAKPISDSWVPTS